MKQVNFKLSGKLLEKMNLKTAETGINRSEYIRRLIENDVE